jgi:hypothetical protein
LPGEGGEGSRTDGQPTEEGVPRDYEAQEIVAKELYEL